MNRFILASILLLGISLACGQQVIISTPTAPPPTATSTATEVVRHATATPPLAGSTPDTAQVVVPSVNVRTTADGEATGKYIYAGQDVVIVECVENWCEIVDPPGWVWQGCLSNNPDELKCEAK